MNTIKITTIIICSILIITFVKELFNYEDKETWSKKILKGIVFCFQFMVCNFFAGYGIALPALAVSCCISEQNAKGFEIISFMTGLTMVFFITIVFFLIVLKEDMQTYGNKKEALKSSYGVLLFLPFQIIYFTLMYLGLRGCL